MIGIKNIGLSVVAFGLIVFSSCSNSQVSESEKTENTTQIDQNESIDFENALIVDVRTLEEFNAGHFEGAINIPLDQLHYNLEHFEGQDQIVIYCKSGTRAGHALKFLESEGYENIINATNAANLYKIQSNQK